MRLPRGFTVVELLIVIAIMGILLVSFPFAVSSFQESRAIDTAMQATVQSLRRAQTLSQSVASDTTWGVYLQTGSVTVFRGASYATRTATFDEVFDLSDSVDPTGVTEIIFAKLTGEPSTTGTITFTSPSRTKMITIYETGALQYE